MYSRSNPKSYGFLLLFLMVVLILVAILQPISVRAATGTLLRNSTGLYPRAIRLAFNGSANGRILASVVAFSGNGIGAIYESTNGGSSFSQVGTVTDPQTSGGLCCATLYELPQQVGSNPAGTLLWAGSVGQDAANRRMALRIWKSNDVGRTWSYLSSCAVATTTGGLWEPEFSIASDGALVCHYADETDAAYSQKLVRVRSYDGITWQDRTNTVASSLQSDRPGMPVVRKLPNGTYYMVYEICTTGGQYRCAIYYRTSSDGWNWGVVTNFGTQPTTSDGRYFTHAPNIAYGGGKLFLVGQMLNNANGSLATGNGQTIFVNTQNGTGAWSTIAAPVAVPSAYDNYCPNYSSALVPSADGASIFEIATDYNGTVCQPYFATGPAGGVIPTATPVNQSPYGGTAWAIPGTIQAENFDLGGEGVAYHDFEPANQSGQYRTADGVDIEVTTDTGGGYNVDYTANGDWMEYTVNVATAGNYTLTERVASLTTTQSFRVEFNGVNKTGTVVIPNTGGWQTWVNLSQTVNLSAGVQIMRIYFMGNDGNLNYVSLSAASGPTATPTRTSTPIGPTATQTRTRTPTPGAATGVIFYQDINYGGVASGIKAKGDYPALPGDVPNDWMSSLRVPTGWIVDAYADGNFTGAICTYTADTSWVGTGCNDNMSSFRIR